MKKVFLGLLSICILVTVSTTLYIANQKKVEKVYSKSTITENKEINRTYTGYIFQKKAK